MSRYAIYTVELTDLGRYTVTVAASSEHEATLIAREVLHGEATTCVEGLTINHRETEAAVAIAADYAARPFDVSGVFRLGFSLQVPAKSRAEAERHARRLYESNCGPFEFEHDGGSAEAFHAREAAL